MSDAADAPKPKVSRARKSKVADSYETGPQQLVREAASSPTIAARLARALGGLSFSSGRLRLGSGSFPQKLIAAPPDLWRGDADKGAALARGLLACPGLSIDTQSHRLHEVRAGAAQLGWLHGFSWLRDLAAVFEGTSGAQYTERLVKLWMQDHGKYPKEAWLPGVIGTRILSWIGHAPMILSSTDQVYRSAVLTSLARDTNLLYRTIEKAEEGLPLLSAASGLIMAGLTLPGREAAENKGAAVLEAALERLVGPDGGFITRSPQDMLAVLKCALTVRAAYTARGVAHPEGLLRAIDRLVPALKGLMLGDGGLASFHGGSPVLRAEMDDVLAVAAINAKPLRNAAHSGYQRLEGGRAVLVMDAGPPPSGKASATAHTAALAFEFSDGNQRLIINCGGDGTQPSAISAALLAAMRSTAAGSTLVLDQANATELRTDGLLGKGVGVVVATRQENQDGNWIDASHDGYEARYGFVHRRRLFLKADGMDLRGEDLLEARRSGKGRAGLTVDVRFHLAPGVTAVITQGGLGAALKLPGGAAWMFRAKNARVELAESISVSAQGARKTQQLVLSSVTTMDGASFNWVLQRQAR